VSKYFSKFLSITLHDNHFSYDRVFFVCTDRQAVSGYGLDDHAMEVRSPAEVKGFFLQPLCPDRLLGPLCIMGTGVISPGLKRGRGVTLTTHPHLLPGSRMSRCYTSSPPKPDGRGAFNTRSARTLKRLRKHFKVLRCVYVTWKRNDA
jgi:hypothetical protein